MRVRGIGAWLILGAIIGTLGGWGWGMPALAEGGNPPDAQSPSAANYTGCGGVIAPVMNLDFEQQVVELTNQERAVQGLPPYKLVSGLTNSARYHATDMMQDGYFDHDTFDAGSSQMVCNTWERISGFYTPPSWLALAENIAAGYGSPAAAMAGWMNSSGHRANILSGGNWEIGVGYAAGGSWGRYWVQNFGRRSGIYPLVINREAASTDTRQVSLYVYGVWDEIRLRNDDGAWTDWIPFSNQMDWDLAPAAGLRSVEAEMRSSAKSASASDTIQLTGVFAPTLTGLPDELHFFYSRAEGTASPDLVRLIPQSDVLGEVLTWQVSATGSWFNAAPQQGTTPEQVILQLQAVDGLAAGTYSGELMVTVSNPPGTLGSPHSVSMTLEVIDGPLQQVYAPAIRK